MTAFGEAWRKAGEHNARVAQVTYSAEYLAYMQSPAWQELRARILERAAGLCESCGRSASLAVHHWTYARLGRERDDDLVALCWDCHEWADRRRRARRRRRRRARWAA